MGPKASTVKKASIVIVKEETGKEWNGEGSSKGGELLRDMLAITARNL